MLIEKPMDHNGIVDQKFDSSEFAKASPNTVNFPSFRRILVAYDRTELSRRALSYAAYFSEVSSADIVIVNIVEDKRNFNELPITIQVNQDGREEQIDIEGRHRPVQLDKPLQDIVKEITTACKDLGLAKNITYEIRQGNSADEIINLSNVLNCDLIVMGSRRIYSRLEGIGSTTRKVSASVKTTILIVQKQRTYNDEF